MAEQFTKADAEAAGWRVVHEADPNAGTANADGFRAEKYHSPPGQMARNLEEWAETAEKLFERIWHRERSIGGTPADTVTLAAEGVAPEDVDPSDESTLRRVPEAHLEARRANDVLLVRSDPNDPESDVVQKVIVAGQETAPETLSEPTTPNSATEAEVRAEQARSLPAPPGETVSPPPTEEPAPDTADAAPAETVTPDETTGDESA